jgi:hypothetical protein
VAEPCRGWLHFTCNGGAAGLVKAGFLVPYIRQPSAHAAHGYRPSPHQPLPHHTSGHPPSQSESTAKMCLPANPSNKSRSPASPEAPQNMCPPSTLPPWAELPAAAAGEGAAPPSLVRPSRRPAACVLGPVPSGMAAAASAAAVLVACSASSWRCKRWRSSFTRALSSCRQQGIAPSMVTRAASARPPCVWCLGGLVHFFSSLQGGVHRAGWCMAQGSELLSTQLDLAEGSHHLLLCPHHPSCLKDPPP